MDSWVQVERFKDGDSANAETFNTPIDQLASRTEYLKRRLGSIVDEGYQSALILNDVDLDAEDIDKLNIGSVVYRAEHGFRLAQAKMHLYDDYTADESAFTLGILINIAKPKGDVLIYGKLDIGGDPLLRAKSMLQTGEEFRPGRYYLSATEPGKITSNPNGPLVYIGSFHSDKTTNNEFSSNAMACINPQFMDIGTSHVHRAYPLVARPAGNVVGDDVIGYLPAGADESTPEKYPTLIFGGTWMKADGKDAVYSFSLDGEEWGNVKLNWKVDGDTTGYKQIDIPASGVFVDLDNGLKVKVMFPEATNSVAIRSELGPDERTWELEFPDAGKGWVNHSVDAIASIDGVTVPRDRCSPRVVQQLHVLFSGSWPRHDNFVYCVFPDKIYRREFSAINSHTTVEIGGTVYEFLANGDEQKTEGSVPVVKAGVISESLHNLAVKVNDGHSSSEAKLIVDGDSIISFGQQIDSLSEEAAGRDFDVVGGTIPLMVVYSDDLYIVGSVIKNASTYVPVTFDGLSAMLYADGASATANYTCTVGTVLCATAYDYEPRAIYDYVMGLHQSVDYYFPPVPAQAAGLFVNGVEVESSALFPTNPTYSIGRKTLHWMEDDSDHRPWPTGVTSHDPDITPEDDKTMAFYFVVGFQCATGPVTSLVPSPGAPIKLYTYGTNEPAYTGDLMIDAALDFSVVDAKVKGYNVAKKGRGGQLLAGPVVERIKAGNGILVSEDPGCPAGQGTVTISVDNSIMRDHFNEIALENAKQEKLGLFPYISLLGWNGSYGNISSAFTVMMRVATNLDPAKNYQLQLKMTMFGTSGFSGSNKRMAGIQLEYNILPDFTNDTHRSLKTGLLVPPIPRQINVPFGHDNGSGYEYVAYDPFVATTESDEVAPKAEDVRVAFSDLPIPSTDELGSEKLKPGYLVAIRISRVSPTGVGGSTEYGEYTAPVGFLSMEWTLEEV